MSGGLDSVLTRSTWADVVRGIIVRVFNELEGPEPTDNGSRWLEVNECLYLFHSAQKWSRQDGRDFAKAGRVWNYLGYAGVRHMKRTILVRVVTAVVLSVFAIGTWATSGELDIGWLRFFSVSVFVATLALAAWDLWLWRVPLTQRIPGVPRDIHGTWRGTLKSLWEDPATGRGIEPLAAYLVVRQTATLVSVGLLTAESKSNSSLASVSAPDGTTVLDYLYLNRPRLTVEYRSRMHHGSAVLDITGRPAKRLEGCYWTDRESRGEMEFTEHKRRLAGDFQDAEEMFGADSGAAPEAV